MNEKAKIVFFGGEPLGVPALVALKKADIVPDLIVCSPDRRAGRGLEMQAPPVKVWALEQDIEVYQPSSYKDPEVRERLMASDWDLFIVVAYNFILPNWLLELPRKGAVNLHPSLLPKLRGPSPIRTAILEDIPDDVGVSVMLLDEKMDHGPILAQAAVTSDEDWPLPGPALDETLANSGGLLLADTIPKWLEGDITPVEQDHEAATYTKLFQKGENKLTIDPHNLPTGSKARETLCKIHAWTGIGDTFFEHNGVRIKVKSARLTDAGDLKILNITPAGKKEMPFEAYFN